MDSVCIKGVLLHYRLAGPAGAPVLALVNSLGTDARIWDGVIARLATRYRTESGRTAPVATLNGTAATTRWLVAILETHQQADGSVRVPEALRPYLGGIAVIEPAGQGA